MKLRINKRFVWCSAAASLASVAAFACWFVLAPPAEVGHRVEAPAPSPPVERSQPRAAALDRQSVASVPSAATDRTVNDERMAQDRSLAVAVRERALRRVAAASPQRGVKLALDLVRAREAGSLEREAVRVLARADRGVFREVLELLLRTADSETALACGSALDAWTPLDATDLGRAVSCATIPEARVVLIRALSLSSPPEVAQVAIEQCVRCDPSPLVRAEALGALSANRLDQVANLIVTDAPLRRAAARALAPVAGTAADRILENCFRTETDPSVLKKLAETLARRSERSRSALLELAQATPERTAIASAALASADRSKRGRNP